MEQAEKALSKNLKQFRNDRKLSLDKLAELTGVSKSMLRQIEIGQSSPTIATIWKIANGLKIPFTSLLIEETQEIITGSFQDSLPLSDKIIGYRLYPMVTFSPERPFETYYVEIDPGASLDAEPHQGNAEEQVYVLQGEIMISVEDQHFCISQKQFISFQANCEHSYKNDGQEMSSAIMQISYLSKQ